MFFWIVFIVGLLVPFIFLKSTRTWVKWLPALVCTIGSLFFGLKAAFFPAPEMAILGEIMYFMVFGLAAIGSCLGAIMVWKIQKVK